MEESVYDIEFNYDDDTFDMIMDEERQWRLFGCKHCPWCSAGWDKVKTE